MNLFQNGFWSYTQKICILSGLFLTTGGVFSASALAQETKFMHVAPKTLAAQKLDPAVFPSEAELYCGTDQCVFGLTRGLVVGGDLAGMLYAPLRQYFDPQWDAGSVYMIDVFGGFQILHTEEAYMNAALGYRRIAFDDGGHDFVSQGITAKVNYTQRVAPRYTQGIRFDGFFVVDGTSLNNTAALSTSSSQHQDVDDAAQYFYHVTEGYPNLRFGLPATVEVFNWGPAQTGIEMPLRIYAYAEPFFIQNSVNFTGDNISYKETEQNFGARLAGIIAYESKTPSRVAGHYGLKGSLGMDIASHSTQVDRSGGADLNLDNRPAVVPYVQVSGSWQF